MKVLKDLLVVVCVVSAMSVSINAYAEAKTGWVDKVGSALGKGVDKVVGAADKLSRAPANVIRATGNAVNNNQTIIKNEVTGTKINASVKDGAKANIAGIDCTGGGCAGATTTNTVKDSTINAAISGEGTEANIAGIKE